MTSVVDDTTNNIRILTPASMWVPLAYDYLSLPCKIRNEYATLLQENPQEFVMRLSNMLRCDVSLEQTRQVTARWKE